MGGRQGGEAVNLQDKAKQDEAKQQEARADGKIIGVILRPRWYLVERCTTKALCGVSAGDVERRSEVDGMEGNERRRKRKRRGRGEGVGPYLSACFTCN